jgi:hypothetical protein
MNTGIKINVDGIELTVPTLDDAAELIRKIRGSQRATNISPRIDQRIEPTPPAVWEGAMLPMDDKTALDHAIAFLSAIANAGANGADSPTMMKALHVDNAKGIGGRTVKINNLLTKIGFRPKEVYRNPRLPDGRVWKRASKFQDAYDAIRRSRVG